jgi:putative PIN family toxin of toxin-antitoxin system
MQKFVLDTNVVLDLFVFGDEAARDLRDALEAGAVHWIATQAMRGELERVLAYPQIVSRLASCELSGAAVLGLFDRLAHLVDVATRAAVVCSDADDQKFIDLAVAHRARLLSKDAAVLTLRKKLAALDVGVTPALAL